MKLTKDRKIMHGCMTKQGCGKHGSLLGRDAEQGCGNLGRDAGAGMRKFRQGWPDVRRRNYE